MGNIKNFSKKTMKRDLEILKYIINHTNSDLTKKIALSELVGLLELSPFDLNINFNRLKLNKNFLAEYIVERDNSILSEYYEPGKFVENIFEEDLINNFLDMASEIQKECPKEIKIKEEGLSKKEFFKVFFNFQNSVFPEDNEIIKDLIDSGRVEIINCEENFSEYDGITVNLRALDTQYVTVKYHNKPNFKTLQSFVHEFGHVSQFHRTNKTDRSALHMDSYLDEVPSCYHENKFIEFVYGGDDCDLKLLELYDNLYGILKFNSDDVLYIYGQIISDIFKELEKKDPKRFKRDLLYFKRNLGLVNDFELLDIFGIKDTDLLRMSETKDNYLKLARKYKK